MNTKVFKVLIYVSVVAILAVIVGQVLWTRQTQKVINGSYKDLVELALTKTTIDFNQHYYAKSLNEHDSCGITGSNCCNIHPDVEKIVVPLDSMLKQEFENIGLNSHFEFCLKIQDSFVFKSNIAIEDSVYLKNSFQKDILCGCNGLGLKLFVIFPEGYSLVSNSIYVRVWWLVSVIGFLVIVFSGALLFRSIMRMQVESGRRIRIINNMAHEFKTPLASIKLASEMLMNEQIIVQPSRVHRYGELLQFEVRRLQFQGEQILNMALLEQGQIMLKFEYVSANAVIKKLVENYLVVRTDLVDQLITNLHSDNDIVYVDLGHFQNVISNLIENAFKYGGEGVTVEVNTGNNSNGILICVVDNGIGIARKYQKVVFERFYRIANSNRHDIKGHGIGLYYVKNILSKMGGRISLTSTPNKGARFEIFFPFEHI